MYQSFTAHLGTGQVTVVGGDTVEQRWWCQRSRSLSRFGAQLVNTGVALGQSTGLWITLGIVFEHGPVKLAGKAEGEAGTRGAVGVPHTANW